MKRVVRGLMIIASVMLSLSAHADLSELIAQANQGDRNAQYQLAIDYQSGQNTPVSQDDAFYWFQQAAESGHPAAMIQLANTYLSGSGTEKDIDKALLWLTKAFATGNQDAAIQIGQLYESLNRSPAPQTMAEILVSHRCWQQPQSRAALYPIAGTEIQPAARSPGFLHRATGIHH